MLNHAITVHDVLLTSGIIVAGILVCAALIALVAALGRGMSQ